MKGKPVKRWRVRFVPGRHAPAEEIEAWVGAWETVVEAESYQRAVVSAGRVLVEGPASNRMWWDVTLVELVESS